MIIVSGTIFDVTMNDSHVLKNQRKLFSLFFKYYAISQTRYVLLLGVLNFSVIWQSEIVEVDLDKSSLRAWNLNLTDHKLEHSSAPISLIFWFLTPGIEMKSLPFSPFLLLSTLPLLQEKHADNARTVIMYV